MAKYIIDVPDDGQCSYRYNEDTKELKFPCPRFDPNSFMGLDIMISDATPYTEPDREAIENEVWDLAQKLGDMNQDQWISCFGVDSSLKSPSDYDYQEARAKYQEWKAKKAEIRVGDEVIIKSDGIKGVVLDEDLCGEFSVFTENGCCEAYRKIHFEKTGRHFNTVERLLEEMREE